MNPLDTYVYMQLADHKTWEQPPMVAYDDEPDADAIANLERLQADRPLRPPSKT